MLTIVADAVVLWHTTVPSKTSVLYIILIVSLISDTHLTIHMKHGIIYVTTSFLKALQVTCQMPDSTIRLINYLPVNLLSSPFSSEQERRRNTCIDERVTKLIELPKEIKETICKAEEIQHSTLDKVTSIFLLSA